ncbi:MAG: hypothetical protein JSV24_05760 [Bacteroidales bacterium]|nr:MAG: hypothetical protein JSV24_05760 [Bacteroidales bacterium]
MGNNDDTKKEIVNHLTQKANLKQVVYDNTLETFNILKEVLQEIESECNIKLKGVDKRVLMDYKDRGKFEAQIKVAGDMLIFSMHSNIFEFDRNHGVWKTSYIQKDKLNSYCGIINIYNFLADSFKYNRVDDLGYLISRIFVNKEKHYFVEGKRQLGFLYSNFGKDIINKGTLQKIIETAILYAMEFDLLVPPYDNVKIASVAQMNKKIQSSFLQTGKRLGFLFNSDDVTEKE